MGLPLIAPYTMPSIDDIPHNRVDWKVDVKRAVLLIHDMQNYFVDAFDRRHSLIKATISNIQTLKQSCVEAGIPVIYSAQPGGQTLKERGLLFDFWGKGIDDEQDQKGIIKELIPDEQDFILTKWRYSAFQRTDLRQILLDMNRDQLMICGIYAHIGCLLTACEAFMLDFQPFFIADAVADFSLADHLMALRYAANRCAVVLTTKQTINMLHTVENESRSSWSKMDLLHVVSKHMQKSPSEIGENDNLSYLGLDSIRIMHLVEEFRRSGAHVTFVDLAERPTLADWLNLLNRS